MNKKIAVVGIGGVGGYLAGMLCHAYPGTVTLVARGSRKDALEKNGLVLHSEYNGEMTGRPGNVCTAQELPPRDYIFLCVKNYSLESACEEIRHAVTKDTVVIPVMNGVDPGEKVRKALGVGTVVESLIYIVAFANPDDSITQQGNYANLFIGIPHASATDRKAVREVSDILTGAGVDHWATDDIEAEIWKKYIFNCAYNVATACYNEPIGDLRKDPAKAQEYEMLVREAYQVACAKGVHVQEQDEQSIIDRFYHQCADDATSSLMRDFAAGKKQTELETFSGYLVREAQRLGVDAPVSGRMYQELKKKL